MDHFCSRSVQAKAVILIRFVNPKGLTKDEREDMIRYRAWMTYEGVKKGKDGKRRKHFTIDINSYEITSRKNIKSLIRRLKNAMLCVGHELTHVKQYLLGEVFDYANGDVRYKGKRYKDWEQGEEYFFSPWEIESYGHEIGLFKCFEMKLKEKL